MKKLLYIVLIASVALNLFQWYKLSQKPKETLRIDTIKIDKPVPYKVTELIPVKRLLPRISGRDTVLDSVIVPVKQVEYRDTSYRAWVSGYEVKLDSIEIYHKTITLYREKRWVIGPQIGIGYNGKITPYIGVGITYNFISF